MTREIDAFLRGYLAEKKSAKVQIRSAFKEWEKFVDGKPAAQVEFKDIDQFILLKRTPSNDAKAWSPKTLTIYLPHIGEYFGRQGRLDLANYVVNERLKIQKETKKGAPANHLDVLKMLNSANSLRDKLVLRLLLLSDIPIGCLGELKVRHIINGKEYEILCNGELKRAELDPETVKIISDTIEETRLGQNDNLIGIGERQIQQWMGEYAKEIGAPNKVTPMDIREFGRSIPREMLLDWLKIKTE